MNTDHMMAKTHARYKRMTIYIDHRKCDNDDNYILDTVKCQYKYSKDLCVV